MIFCVKIISMEQRRVIYVIIGGLTLCLLIFYYFDKDLSNEETSATKVVISTNSPSFTLLKGALEQASRVPKEAEQQEKSDDDEDLDEDDLETFFDGWTIQRIEGSGRVFSVNTDGSGKNTTLPGEGLEAVLAWGKQVVPLFGGNPDHFNTVDRDPGTNLIKHYSMKQVVNGYEVYGGYVKVSAIRNNQVFNVNNSIKIIDEENFDTNLVYNRDQAWIRIQNEFSSSVNQLNAENYRQPQLFVRSSPGDSDFVQELAWVFDVSVNSGKPDVRRVIVGGISGNILSQIMTIVH